MSDERAWAGTTYGNSLMHRWLIAMLRFLDVRLLYAFASVLVVPPAMLFRPGGRHSYRYFRERHGYGRIQALRATYRNHCLFAQAVVDKFAMYAGKRFAIEVEGYAHFARLARQPEGFVILSSHIGNYEIAGYSFVSDEKPINALVFLGEKASVMENRSRMFEHTRNRMIPLRADMSHLFEIDAALGRGEIVSIPADRVWGAQKTVAQPFLGREAQFPQGPFSVAAMRGLAVLTVHVMKTSAKGYRIHVSPLDYDRAAPRRQQTGQLAAAYVDELERLLRQYPEQWYNYYDFWT